MAALQKISVGKTVSYTKIAYSLNTFAIRAVAGACAPTLLAVVIPCHRVIRNNGASSGYRWGRECKKKLLEIERV